ncbi:MAG: translation initiation factor IF-2 [Muribaculaceae bacterium]|nr:translation initiation factor IF-2 [Muribaculaceae bacterium]
MPQKLNKIAKELNVSVPTIIEFLRKKNITVDESPNTRIEDNVADMLTSAFASDKDLKNRSAQIATERKEIRQQRTEVKAPQAPAEESITTKVQKPRILGKIELDSKGNPVQPKAEAPKPEAPKPVQAEEPKHEAPKPVQPSAPVEEKKPAAPKPETVKAEAPKVAPVVEKKVETPKPEAPKPTVQKPEAPKAETPKPEAPKPAAAAEEKKSEPTSGEQEVFTIERSTPSPSLKIVGTIDLSSMNLNTRPKKRSKDDRRGNKPGQPANQGGDGDRKKRRRISGKEKVDIEKAGKQVADNRNNGGGGNNNRRNNGGNGGNNNQGGRNNGGEAKRGNQRNARPVQPEVSEEDVQKQVRETLARLTSKDKALKRGAKWRKEKREANAEHQRELHQAELAESKVLKITEFVTANELAVMMDVPVNNVIATCMNIGIMVSINQRLDAETINIVAEEFGFTTEYVSAEVSDAIQQEEDNEEDLVSRPPVVTVMGHVDHGKTSLLDYIRKANVIAGEAGGITQHIGSYNVKLADGRHITFLDTPGHEAFTAMRARGAKVTDLVIIIVAADDAVMPQTVEAINHASAAGVPIVFAINKVDKPHANPEKIKEELAAMNYLVEDWGGKYQSQDISAKQGLGVEELMEKVLLEAEMLDLKANPKRRAVGTIIESTLDKGRGYVANVLVQNGTLHVGDIVLAGNNFGRVKAMFNERNQRIKEAGPAMPALILGLNGAPAAGDTFNVLETEQEAREIANKREQLAREQGLRTTKMLTLEDIGRRRAIGNFQELNIIVKGDVDGSIEALSDSLIKLSTDEIQINVLHKAVGEISESDVTLAAASDAIIIGFQVRPSVAARRAAERDGVQIRLYSVIYQAIEEVKDAMAGMLAPEIKEEVTGTAEVLETFHVSKVGTIAGAMVREGKIRRGCKLRLIRDGIVRYTGDLGSLKRFKDDVKEVSSGFDCGISIAGYNDVKVGDMLEAFEEKEVARTSID